MGVQQVFELKNVEVRYGAKVAIKDFSLSIHAGESLALLGQNGAGKTSTIRVLLGMIRPKSGSCHLFGKQPGSVEALKKLGYSPEEGSPPDFLNGAEYLDFVLGLRRPKQGKRKQIIEGFLNQFELEPPKRIRDYSKGMRRRLLLAQALIGNPEFLVLDEPLNGLDPIFIVRLREQLENYVKQGGSLLFSSHILAEAEKICTSVAILHTGKLALAETAQSVVEKHGSIEKAFIGIAEGKIQ